MSCSASGSARRVGQTALLNTRLALLPIDTQLSVMICKSVVSGAERVTEMTSVTIFEPGLRAEALDVNTVVGHARKYGLALKMQTRVWNDFSCRLRSAREAQAPL